jgi:fucose permease
MLIALSTCLVGTLVVPLARHIGVLAASMAAQGLVMGFLDTGVNSLLFVIHKDGRVEPFMQALHFFFGLGAFISPLVVGAVLDAYGGEVKVAWTILGLVGSPLLLLMLRYPTPGKPGSEAFYADEMDPIPSVAATSATNAHSVEGTAIEPTRVNIEAADGAAQDADAAAGDAAAPSFFARPRSELGVIAASAGILYFAVGIEVCSGSFIPTFSVKSPLIGFNEHKGSNLVASFWASFTLARFVAIFVSVRLSPLQLLCSCLAGLGLSISVRACVDSVCVPRMLSCHLD